MTARADMSPDSRLTFRGSMASAIGVCYSTDASVKKIVDGLQTRFELASNRRENFGPTIQKKLGQDHPVSGHTDHFHWSVDGDHSACANVPERYTLEIEDTKEAVEAR